MLPIWNKDEAQLIYTSLKENQHEKKALEIAELENGKNYQIGIFPCTTEGITCLSPMQLIGQPRYIRPKQVINYNYVELARRQHSHLILTENEYTNISIDIDDLTKIYAQSSFSLNNDLDDLNNEEYIDNINNDKDIVRINLSSLDRPRIANIKLDNDSYMKNIYKDNTLLSNNEERYIYKTAGDINIGEFYWHINKFITRKNTTFWFEAIYPLIEG